MVLLESDEVRNIYQPVSGLIDHLTCRYYLATSRELKRLDAVSRSPIYAWFSESLAGLSTIRAFNQQSVFIARNENYLDRNQMCYLPSTSVNRWLAVRLELVGATIIFVTALLAVTGLITTGVDAGLVGLVLSYALTTTSSLVSIFVVYITRSLCS
jgi:ATP-binding cassette subfamily C (CFTR/MRP) protein 1